MFSVCFWAIQRCKNSLLFFCVIYFTRWNSFLGDGESFAQSANTQQWNQAIWKTIEGKKFSSTPFYTLVFPSQDSTVLLKCCIQRTNSKIYMPIHKSWEILENSLKTEKSSQSFLRNHSMLSQSSNLNGQI
jgi:hypothetical protein